MTVGMDLVCSYVGGWLCRLFWHLLLNLGASVPAVVGLPPGFLL